MCLSSTTSQVYCCSCAKPSWRCAQCNKWHQDVVQYFQGLHHSLRLQTLICHRICVLLGLCRVLRGVWEWIWLLLQGAKMKTLSCSEDRSLSQSTHGLLIILLNLKSNLDSREQRILSCSTQELILYYMNIRSIRYAASLEICCWCIIKQWAVKSISQTCIVFIFAYILVKGATTNSCFIHLNLRVWYKTVH